MRKSLVMVLSFAIALMVAGFSTIAYELESDPTLYVVEDEEADNIAEAFPEAYTAKAVSEASPDLFFYGVIEEDQANLYEWLGSEAE